MMIDVMIGAVIALAWALLFSVITGRELGVTRRHVRKTYWNDPYIFEVMYGECRYGKALKRRYGATKYTHEFDRIRQRIKCEHAITTPH